MTSTLHLISRGDYRVHFMTRSGFQVDGMPCSVCWSLRAFVNWQCSCDFLANSTKVAIAIFAGFGCSVLDWSLMLGGFTFFHDCVYCIPVYLWVIFGSFRETFSIHIFCAS